MAVAFATTLRRSNVKVPTRSVLDFVAALDHVGIDTRAAVYWAGRATLVRRPEDIPPFDRAFATFWLQRELLSTTATIEPVVLEIDDDLDDEPAPEPDQPPVGPNERTITVRYSPVELLRTKDFALYTHAEFDEARKVMADLRLGGALRTSRRLRRSKRRRPTAHPDLRRTVRHALKMHGEPLRRAHFEPTTRPRRLVLLCDVSGSMEAYTRALLRFLHAAVIGRRQVEAFALGTRLTRITRELSSHDPDAALRAAGQAVEDWSGGTRLGDALRTFNDRHGVRGMARGAVVVILSDGWDRGEPEVLAEQVARLRRVAYRVVWVNPLKATPGYAPLARGMAAALPHVDTFVEGHSIDALERLAAVIAGEGVDGPPAA